jgi:hypothetical protein
MSRQKYVRELTDHHMEALEVKQRSGDWVSVDQVRRLLHNIIDHYEQHHQEEE